MLWSHPSHGQLDSICCNLERTGNAKKRATVSTGSEHPNNLIEAGYSYWCCAVYELVSAWNQYWLPPFSTLLKWMSFMTCSQMQIKAGSGHRSEGFWSQYCSYKLIPLPVLAPFTPTGMNHPSKPHSNIVILCPSTGIVWEGLSCGKWPITLAVCAFAVFEWKYEKGNVACHAQLKVKSLIGLASLPECECGLEWGSCGLYQYEKGSITDGSRAITTWSKPHISTEMTIKDTAIYFIECFAPQSLLRN